MATSAQAKADPGTVSRTGLARPLTSPFISIAFTAALIFGPLVIATGLLTAHRKEIAEATRQVSVASFASGELRQSLDGESSSFRSTED